MLGDVAFADSDYWPSSIEISVAVVSRQLQVAIARRIPQGTALRLSQRPQAARYQAAKIAGDSNAALGLHADRAFKASRTQAGLYSLVHKTFHFAPEPYVRWYSEGVSK